MNAWLVLVVLLEGYRCEFGGLGAALHVVVVAPILS